MSSINSSKSDGRKEKRKKFASHVPEIQLSRYYFTLVEKKIDTSILSVFDFIDHKVQAITLTCAPSVFKRYRFQAYLIVLALYKNVTK